MLYFSSFLDRAVWHVHEVIFPVKPNRIHLPKKLLNAKTNRNAANHHSCDRNIHGSQIIFSKDGFMRRASICSRPIVHLNTTWKLLHLACKCRGCDFRTSLVGELPRTPTIPTEERIRFRTNATRAHPSCIEIHWHT